jgi:hypothetical protein
MQKCLLTLISAIPFLILSAEPSRAADSPDVILNCRVTSNGQSSPDNLTVKIYLANDIINVRYDGTSGGDHDISEKTSTIITYEAQESNGTNAIRTKFTINRSSLRFTDDSTVVRISSGNTKVYTNLGVCEKASAQF